MTGTRVKRKAREIVQPTRITPTAGKVVQNPWEFLLKTGMLFELNRLTLHRYGYALAVWFDRLGRAKPVLFDHSDNPVVTFEPEQFEQGMKKLRTWVETEGTPIIRKRQRLLGISVQKLPNYRDQITAA